MPRHLKTVHQLEGSAYFEALKDAKKFVGVDLDATASPKPSPIDGTPVIRQEVGKPVVPLPADDDMFDMFGDEDNGNDDGVDDNYDGGHDDNGNDENIDALMEKFRIHLGGPDGGNRSVKVSVEVVSDVKRLLFSIGCTNSVVPFFENRRFRDKYIFGYCKEKKIEPTSITKYLCSLDLFCLFLLKEKPDYNIPLEKVLGMRINIECWKKSYKKAKRSLFFDRNTAELEMLLTPDQVQKYKSGTHALDAVELLKNLLSSSSLTQTS